MHSPMPFIDRGQAPAPVIAPAPDQAPQIGTAARVVKVTHPRTRKVVTVRYGAPAPHVVRGDRLDVDITYVVNLFPTVPAITGECSRMGGTIWQSRNGLTWVCKGVDY